MATKKIVVLYYPPGETYKDGELCNNYEIAKEILDDMVKNISEIDKLSLALPWRLEVLDIEV